MPEKISLKAARVNANLTQAEAAKRIGIDRTTLVKWESHPESVRSIYHKQIASVYGIDSDAISFLQKDTTLSGI